ncbi:hypothetical protein PAF17_16425 [Paracoccus sp. Z330]|uniref:Restriction endonuclease type IV Mrr domain-containing protein n=1 Tax=Paracoccus onchidii TaxID=3017813 RepID=A0ABT4ZI99_9RHOB|nr:hypothetical protein [Paracoccus onchidii]MDB6179079.1 hypothetical protein [Paracoccus onchidii]
MTPKKETTEVDKGGLAEECLAQYFRELGSFVVRGVPVREGTDEVTDIDLWIYTRLSAHARHVSIVDIKNKRRGKAFERAIWVKGLQVALGADEAIIASQGVKDSAQKFSDRVKVRVIPRPLFDAIIKRYAGTDNRISNEEFESQLSKVTLDKVNLKKKIANLKSEISNGIDFRTLNIWLDEAAELLRHATEREPNGGPITRAAYLCCSLISIAADFLGKEHSLSETATRQDFFRQGLLFGRTDFDAKSAYLAFAENLVTEFLDPTGSSASQIRSGFEKAVDTMPIQGLAEFFARPHASSDLLRAAVSLDGAAYSEKIDAPRSLQSVEAKMIIGLVSDYAGLRRKDVLGNKPDTDQRQALELPQGQGKLL